MTGTGHQANRGIIYVATGRKYVEEAIASALSCREYMPALPIHLFTPPNRAQGFQFRHLAVEPDAQ